MLETDVIFADRQKHDRQLLPLSIPTVCALVYHSLFELTQPSSHMTS